jgi:hypothetical protein
MTYLLDFDRTLFDTEAFKRMLSERFFTGEPYVSVDVVARFHEDGRSGALTFAPGELASFVYDDARVFIERYASEIAIITYGDPALQRMKVESAFPTFTGTVHYTGQERKAYYLEQMAQSEGEVCVVDDAPIELAAWTERFPGFSLYEIRRDGAPGDGRWQVIRSCAELPVTPARLG